MGLLMAGVFLTITAAMAGQRDNPVAAIEPQSLTNLAFPRHGPASFGYGKPSPADPLSRVGVGRDAILPCTLLDLGPPN